MGQLNRYCLVICSVVLAFLCESTPASAQDRCRSGTGVIKGVVRDDSTGAGLGGSWVALIDPFCRVVTDSAGHFRFDGLPARSIQIDAGHPGYRRYSRTSATVATGQTTEVEIRLRPGGPLQDCRVNVNCARLLREPILPNATEEEQFRLVAYVTMLAIAWTDVTRERGWYACVEENSQAVVNELTVRWDRVAAAADCGFRGDVRDRLIHTPTGNHAFFVRMRNPQQTSAGRRRAEVSYLVGGLWGQSWTCNFERIDGTWRATLCVHDWEA